MGYAELDQNDRKMVFNMIEKLLTNKKFKTFFKENIQP